MYHEEPFVQPFVGSIADLIARPAEARANALRAATDAQARAVETSAAARAQAIGSIGNTVSNGIASAVQYQQDAPRRALQAVQLQQLQRQAQAPQVLAKAIQQNTQRDPSTGKTTINHEAVAASVSAAGFPDQAESWLRTTSENAEHLQKLDDLAQAHRDKQFDTVGGLIGHAKTQEDFNSALGLITANAGSEVDKDLATQVLKDANEAGSNWQAVAKKYRMLSPSDRKSDATVEAEMNKPMNVPEGGTVNTPARGVAGLPPLISGAPKAKTKAELAADAANPNSPTAAASKSALDLLTPQPAPSEAGLDAAFQKLEEKRSSGQPLSGAEQAAYNAYKARKLLVPDNGQAATNARLDKSETFHEAELGKKELTDKYEAPYQDAIAKAALLKNVVELAKSGNMVAGSLQPLIATMTTLGAEGFKRLTGTELSTTAGAGSAWDRLSGKIGKLVEGQPIPADVQKDMLTLADALSKSAYDKYKAGFDSTTKRYKLTDEQPLPAPGSTAPAPPPLTPGLQSLKDRK